jgi:membrane fusion protein (multidrug efflux system)
MATSFSRTMRSLESRRLRPGWYLVALVVLAGWMVWMVSARVNVYASSSAARLEVSGTANRVAAQEGGRIVVLHVQLGRMVTEGEVLVALDTTVEQRHLDEELAHTASLEPRLEALRRQITAANEVRFSRARLNALTTRRGELGLRQAAVVARHQEKLGLISQQLSNVQVESRVEKMKTESEVVDSRLRLKGARVEVSRLLATRQYEDETELARIAELERQLADLEGQQKEAQSAVATARAQIERRNIRAPAAGKLGNIAPLQVGEVLKVGDVVATVIPSDDIHVVAEFAPSDAVGRILPRQTAWVRLSGFSWTQFGMLEAVVTDVASEPRDGTVRVELVIAVESARSIPIQHGLPGSVDVQVDRVSPWGLLMRSLGSAVGRPRPPPPTQGSSDVARAR